MSEADRNQTTEDMAEVVRLARALVNTADLSQRREMTVLVSSDHLAELMEALEKIRGVECERAVVLCRSRRPTDDEMRAIHDAARKVCK